jgi:prephenate dehydrogenase
LTKPGTLAVIGAGSFGRFMIPHLAPHFSILANDPLEDIDALACRHGISPASLEEAARAEPIVLAVPIGEVGVIARKLAPLLQPRTLVVDVCSVKVEPLELLAEILPADCAIVGTHPLFGPNSCAAGIAGRKISVCEVRGGRIDCVAAFLRDRLGLEVIVTTPEEHDRQLAVAQGLTHLLGRILVAMDLPRVDQTTPAFDHLQAMAGIVGAVSADLSRALAEHNPHASEIRRRFYRAVAEIERADRDQ